MKKKKSYLFVCRDNWVRSRVGAEIFKEFLKKEKIEANVESAGIGFLAYFFGKHVKFLSLKKFDVVFVMKDYMEKELKQVYGFKGKIVNLKVLNKYWVVPIPPFKSVKELKKVLRDKNWRRLIQ